MSAEGRPDAAESESAARIETAFRFLNEIAIVAQLSGTAFERVMPGTLTLSQFAVLNHLVRRGGDRTPLQIATAMQVTKGTMTNTLGHLQRAGWISIRPDTTDRRSKRVDLTEAGRAVHREAIRALAPDLAWLAGMIPPDRLAGALPVIEDVRKALDRRRDPEPGA